MKTMLALSLLVFTLGADQVTSNYCCVGDQFSAGFAGTVFAVSDYATDLFRIKGDAAMDYTFHRYAYNFSWYDYEEKLSGNTRYIFLYKEGIFFQIFDDTECYSIYRGQEPSQCLPDDAYLDDTVFFGHYDLLTDSWKMRIHMEEGFHSDLRLATTSSCIPVASSMILKTKYDRSAVEGVLFDYDSWADPSAFTIPEICNNATKKLKYDRLKLFHKWNLLRKGMVFF